ncbi:MAG: hypothetical protein CMP98_05015 [Gammaproteobacteria bacterium]|nr:hypothetical protein [Gammaproteobacteria bacterium]OUU10377.1 MAG: hypothetical protein CBB94_05165 [Gammaproteobacteria bacterium TMED34]
MYFNGSATVCEQWAVWISPLNLLIAEVCKEVRATMGPRRWWRSAYDRVQASGATGLPPYQITLEGGAIFNRHWLSTVAAFEIERFIEFGNRSWLGAACA